MFFNCFSALFSFDARNNYYFSGKMWNNGTVISYKPLKLVRFVYKNALEKTISKENLLWVPRSRHFVLRIKKVSRTCERFRLPWQLRNHMDMVLRVYEKQNLLCFIIQHLHFQTGYATVEVMHFQRFFEIEKFDLMILVIVEVAHTQQIFECKHAVTVVSWRHNKLRHFVV